jgi:DNA-binding protein YbaB
MLDKLGDQGAKMKEELSAIEINVVLEGITIQGDASGELKDINISAQLYGEGDKEKIEDLLLMAITKYNDRVGEESANLSKRMLNDMLGGGFGNLFG